MVRLCELGETAHSSPLVRAIRDALGMSGWAITVIAVVVLLLVLTATTRPKDRQ